MHGRQDLVARFGNIEEGTGRARQKRALEERLADFEQAGGNIEVLDWRDMRWSPRLHRRVWQHPLEHERGQIGRESKMVELLGWEARSFEDVSSRQGPGAGSIAQEACEAFLEPEKGRETANGQKRWNRVLMIARSQDGRLQGVALSVWANPYVNCLTRLASRGEVRGTGSALLRAVALMTLEEVAKINGQGNDLKEYVTLRGWRQGCLEVDANLRGQSMYVQYGAQKLLTSRRGRDRWLRHRVVLAGATLRSLAGMRPKKAAKEEVSPSLV